MIDGEDQEVLQVVLQVGQSRRYGHRRRQINENTHEYMKKVHTDRQKEKHRKETRTKYQVVCGDRRGVKGGVTNRAST